MFLKIVEAILLQNKRKIFHRFYVNKIFKNPSEVFLKLESWKKMTKAFKWRKKPKRRFFLGVGILKINPNFFSPKK